MNLDPAHFTIDASTELRITFQRDDSMGPDPVIQAEVHRWVDIHGNGSLELTHFGTLSIPAGRPLLITPKES